MAVVVVLLVLAIVSLLVLAVGTLAASGLQVVNADRYSKVSLYAAEAGAAAAISQLRVDPTWSSGYSNVAFGSETDSRYWVEVSNNFAGVQAVQAPDGTSVPAGKCYLRATGRCLASRYARSVAVMLEGPGDNFVYALASGGTATLRASGDIYGSVRSNGDLQFDAATDVYSVNGEGRVLSAGKIINKNLGMEADQDVRARGSISDPDKISGTVNIVANDTSADTLPMVADGRITNDGSPLTMPNPDLAVLLAPGSYVDHTGTTRYNNRQTLNLNGQVHYFPQGVTFDNGSRITGPGTIVVGGGHSAVFNTPQQDARYNVVVLDSNGGRAANGNITFNQSTVLTGLVYCQGDIDIKARLTLYGRMIAYGNGEITARAGANFDLHQTAVSVPGFAAFFGGAPAVGGPLTISSWQRVSSR
jgi:hypothetical protein